MSINKPSYVSSIQITIAPQTSQWGLIGIKGANVLSSGFQNMGFQSRCYATQLFSGVPDNICYQIDNLNDTPVVAVIHAVTDGPATLGAPVETGSKKLSC